MFLKPAPAGAMRSKNVNPLLCKKAERVVHVFADLIAAPRASTAYRTPRTRHRVLPGRRGCRGTADTPPCAGSTRRQVVPLPGSLSVARGTLAATGGGDGQDGQDGQNGQDGQCPWCGERRCLVRQKPLSEREPLGAARDAVWSSKSPFVRQAEALGVGFGRR